MFESPSYISPEAVISSLSKDLETAKRDLRDLEDNVRRSNRQLLLTLEAVHRSASLPLLREVIDACRTGSIYRSVPVFGLREIENAAARILSES